MFLAFLLALALPAEWVPARWQSSDPGTLDLLTGTPVNCLVVERPNWSPAFAAKAAEQGVAVLGLVRPNDDLNELPARAAAAKLQGFVFEGTFEQAALSRARAALADSKLTSVSMGPRTRMDLQAAGGIVATNQGVWPGINAAEDGKEKAAPSGAPWIDTNSGFLRFVRASLDAGQPAQVWIAYQPPANLVIPAARYLQAVADAEMLGAHWLVTLDADLQKRLFAREEKAVDTWKKMMQLLGYFQSHPEWRRASPYGQLALVQDVESGGLITGGILDMISVKHTPVRPVPGRKLSDEEMKQAKMAVNVDPSLLTDEQKQVLRRFTRGGGTLLTAPPGWKFPPQRDDQITLDKENVEKLDQIWKEVNSMTGRNNLGARLFNVASVLSYMTAAEGGKRLTVHLVNYSDYDVEDVTVHLLGKWKSIKFLAPGKEPRPLTVFETEDGTGVEIDKFGIIGTLIAE
ncbi:MAG: hypothetical protein ABI972_26100 [Acidobacteriota bacterium]